MEISAIQALILGIIQGLGEFLPISSTAHLILAPYFFGWSDPGLSFDVALHLGTLIAVVAYFYYDWIEIFSQLITHNSKPKEKLLEKSCELRPACNDVATSGRVASYGLKNNLLFFIIIATIPGVIAGYFFEKDAETIFRNPLLIAFTLGAVGLILYVADKFSKKERNISEISLKDAIIIGLAQAVAIIPGVSRSGATITAGLFRKLDRASAAKFSFLLSTPIIFGAVILKLPHLLKEGINMQIIIAVLASAISGYLAIKYLLKFLEKSSYAIFFWYRLILAVVIIIFYISQ
jgi:undecaprenyl-diphosphatase